MLSLGTPKSLFLCKYVQNLSFFCCLADYVLFVLAYSVRFGPRESKKAITYSDVGRLNCNVSYTTFASPTLGSQVSEFYLYLGLDIFCVS